MYLVAAAIVVLLAAAAAVGGEVTENEAECGILIGGVTPGTAGASHLPWVVRLAHRNAEGTLVYGCVGTLINRNTVVTAARCVQRDITPSVVVVPNCGGSDTCSPHGESRYYSVSRVVSHPAHSGWPGDKDIALVRLDRPIDSPRAGGTPALCLPLGPFPSDPLLGRDLVVAAWNIHQNGTTVSRTTQYYTLPLRTAVVNVLKDDECQRQFKDNAVLQNSQLCARGRGLEPCVGDTGAPLHELVGDPPRAVLVGLLSFGAAECGNSDLPAVYTKVSSHLLWISDAMLALQ